MTTATHNTDTDDLVKAALAAGATIHLTITPTGPHTPDNEEDDAIDAEVPCDVPDRPGLWKDRNGYIWLMDADHRAHAIRTPTGHWMGGTPILNLDPNSCRTDNDRRMTSTNHGPFTRIRLEGDEE
ncbi:hypothetical protein [Bifidobacterium platyrrhinorum]|uniref:Uncharacterized protein n=1 Tax=Bifidobacterium platyrrhinorum TaxID=2661628 RepID=A0A6L9SYF9_9BIFI|nr:hypothetical protein [Bifidobacterium platyrrhinorum]NEG56151.1 hypothetical protein [Bifidobacterium platyrrhinorum]